MKKIKGILISCCLAVIMVYVFGMQTDNVYAAYDGTLDGFIEWMLTQDDLTSEQQEDLETAQSLLAEFVEAGYVDLSDEDDAAYIDNVESAVGQLKKAKSLRESDQYYNQIYDMTDLYTNFEMMVGSAYTANVSIYEIAHVSSFGIFSSNEGLAWGTSSPVSAWYSEIEYIDEAMSELGYSVSSLTESLWSEVKSQAYSYGEIGHYTGLFYGVSSGYDTLMGIGYTTEPYLYGITSSYNAKAVSSGDATYTPSQFQELIDSYKEYLISSDNVKLSYSSCAYSGKAKKPAVTVTVDGKTLTEGTDYKLTYSNNTDIGTASVKIEGIGSYYGTVSKTFKIVPKKAKIKKLKSSSKKITVKWKKVSGSVTNYIIRYRYKKGSGFSSWKKKTVSASSLTVKLTGLKSKKTYQVKVRAYKTVSNKKYYGKWSKAKKVKTK